MRLSAGDLLAKTLNFLAFVYLARVLGVESFGVLEFASTLLVWFLLAADGGLEIWGTREAAQTSELRTLVGRMVPLRLALAGMSFALLLGVLSFLPGEPILKVVLALFGLCLFAQAVSLKWVFLGHEKMARVAVGLVVAQIVFAGAVFSLVRDPLHVLYVPLIRLASDLAMAVYFAQMFWRAHGSLRLLFTFRGGAQMLRPALAIGATNAMGALNYNFDSALLGFLKGATTVGWYAAAYKPVTIALALPLTYFTGLFPALSRAWTEGPQALGQLAGRSLRLCAIFAVPVGVGGTLLAAPVIGLLFGPAYARSVVPFEILVWSAVLIILRGSWRHALNAAGKQNLDLRCAIVSASLNVGLNLLLIPRYEMPGAATATVVADAVWLAMAGYYFRGAAGASNLLAALARPVVAGAAMGACLMLADSMFWVARGAAGVAIYFGALILLGEKEVWGWVRKVSATKT